ncbi:MAG: TlpA family protein disulfide reductase, partial [bacterium]
CPDCKGMAPALARIEADFGPRGLSIVAPTRRYGYTRRGEDAGPAEEATYITEVRKSAYGTVKDMPAPIDEDAFRAFGASTVPTIILVDAAGIVRFYHPGEMTYDELAPRIEALLKPLGRAAAAR